MPVNVLFTFFMIFIQINKYIYIPLAPVNLDSLSGHCIFLFYYPLSSTLFGKKYITVGNIILLKYLIQPRSNSRRSNNIVTSLAVYDVQKKTQYYYIPVILVYEFNIFRSHSPPFPAGDSNVFIYRYISSREKIVALNEICFLRKSADRQLVILSFTCT